MQRHQHCNAAFPHQLLQDRQELDLVADVQIGGGLVHHQDLRFLADSPGQHYQLALPVTHSGDLPVPKFSHSHQLHGLQDLVPVFLRQDPEMAGIRITPHGSHVETGHQLRPGTLRQDHRHPLRSFLRLHAGEILFTQKYGSPERFQLPGNRLQKSRLPGTVGSHKSGDLSGTHGKRQVLKDFPVSISCRKRLRPEGSFFILL